MPSWGIHLATAAKICEKIDIDKDLFLIGNLLPDINNGYLIKNITCIKKYDQTHYSKMININGQEEILPDLELFYNENKENLKDNLVLGYFVHLLTDYSWNKSAYLNHGVLNDKKERIGMIKNTKEIFYCDNEKARILKTNDFNIYSHILYKKGEVDLPNIKDDMLDKSLELLHDIIFDPLVENESFNEEYLNLIILEEYLKHEKCQKEKEKINKNYEIYTQDEIEEQFENTILFILDILKKLKIY